MFSQLIAFWASAWSTSLTMEIGAMLVAGWGVVIVGCVVAYRMWQKGKAE